MSLMPCQLRWCCSFLDFDVGQVGLSALVQPTQGAGCTCTGATLAATVAATYGPGYGSQCYAWDNANCGSWWGNALETQSFTK